MAIGEVFTTASDRNHKKKTRLICAWKEISTQSVMTSLLPKENMYTPISTVLTNLLADYLRANSCNAIEKYNTLSSVVGVDEVCW